jgi:uncharacterized protein (TIGR02996 family)
MASSPSPPAARLRPEFQVFLEDVKSHPEDDTPRLIFADWLQEHGSPQEAARGELIRIQVLQGQLLPSDPRAPALNRREKELLRRHLDDWVGPVMNHLTWRFERGFLHLEGRAEKVLDDDVAALATPEFCAWVEALSVREVRTQQAGRLASCPFLPYVHTLHLGDNRLPSPGVVALVRSPNLTRLRALWLEGNRIGLTGALAIASSHLLAGLRTLDLRGNRIRDEGAFALADSPHLGGLTALALGSNGISERGQAALRARFGGRVRFS